MKSKKNGKSEKAQAMHKRIKIIGKMEVVSGLIMIFFFMLVCFGMALKLVFPNLSGEGILAFTILPAIPAAMSWTLLGGGYDGRFKEHNISDTIENTPKVLTDDLERVINDLEERRVNRENHIGHLFLDQLKNHAPEFDEAAHNIIDLEAPGSNPALRELHFPALAAFALRCWLRLLGHCRALPLEYQALSWCSMELAIAFARGNTTKEKLNELEERYCEIRKAVSLTSPGLRSVTHEMTGAKDVFKAWSKTQPGYSPAFATLIQGADYLYVAAGESAGFRLELINNPNLHDHDYEFYQQHEAAIDYSRRLWAMIVLVLPETKPAIQRDLELLYKSTPLIKNDHMPETAGYLDPMENGPLGPL